MKTWNGEPVIYATDKYDGFGMVLAKSAIGESSLSSNKRTWWPVHNTWYKNFIRHVPNNTKLHVEVFVQGGEATDVIHNLVRDLELSMRVTGVETWHGVNMTLADLTAVDAFCDSCGLQAANWERWIPNISYADLAIHRKIEGFVLKTHSYVPERMYKVKPVLTADLVISGFTEGAGKYICDVGAIICIDGEKKEVCKVSGMTDEVRFSLVDSDIGRVIEVAYQKVTKDKKLRHPRFKRFRNDEAVVDVI